MACLEKRYELTIAKDVTITGIINELSCFKLFYDISPTSHHGVESTSLPTDGVTSDHVGGYQVHL